MCLTDWQCVKMCVTLYRLASCSKFKSTKQTQAAFKLSSYIWFAVPYVTKLAMSKVGIEEKTQKEHPAGGMAAVIGKPNRVGT